MQLTYPSVGEVFLNFSDFLVPSGFLFFNEHIGLKRTFLYEIEYKSTRKHNFYASASSTFSIN